MAPFSTITLTRMPEKTGDRVKPGHVIAAIDGRPMILLRGRLPAYRDLHEGDHGPDVSQLQRELIALGYADYDASGYFGASTALALLLFYRHLGYDAPIYHHRHARSPATAAEPAIPPRAAPATANIAARLTPSAFGDRCSSDANRISTRRWPTWPWRCAARPPRSHRAPNRLPALLRPPILSLRRAASSLRCSTGRTARLRCSLLGRPARFGLGALATPR